MQSPVIVDAEWYVLPLLSGICSGLEGETERCVSGIRKLTNSREKKLQTLSFFDYHHLIIGQVS